MTNYLEGKPASTQTLHPWRTTLRTLLQALIGLVTMWALIVETLGLDPSLPWVATSLTVTAGMTRLMAIPVVDNWLETYLPWLASSK